MIEASPPYKERRWLFVLTILTGSFLLFLVQPMVARMALPRLGGAPNVWNSAMLVYQALLLGGYAYAHFIGRFSLVRQGMIQLAVLALGALTLPLALAEIPPPAPGWEAFWVPGLFLITVGPAFFAVAAQAPLLQSWYARHPRANNPYPLYAASNLGSFGGLLLYPLVAEPLFSIGQQSGYWAIGYFSLIGLVAATVWSRRDTHSVEVDGSAAIEMSARSGWKRAGLWIALSAIPSGLMLSTTTFLTTDIMAMPLLWVIPLGLYLLSYSIAFAERRGPAAIFVFLAPIVLLVDGSIAMFAAGRADLLAAGASVVLLFVTAVALHTRLYEARPHPGELTRFYLFISAGGALGGLFSALIAPVVFDWTWEHPLLILGAAALLPLGPWRRIIGECFSDPRTMRLALVAIIALVFVTSLQLFQSTLAEANLSLSEWLVLLALLCVAMVLSAKRWSYVSGVAALLLSLGGLAQFQTSIEGLRERSYFGIYSIRQEMNGDTVLMHGTTVHGVQRSLESGAFRPTSYYGRTSGVGAAMMAAPAMYGSNARIGVVGLGVGTLACYRRAGQDWTFFEIDPVVLDYSDRGFFTYLSRCAPEAPVVIGDARIKLGNMPADNFDLLVIDAFSSDAIPLHLLTDEALGVYLHVLDDDGVLVMHISNNYIRLEPVIARLAEERGLAASLSYDGASDSENLYASTWVALARDPATLSRFANDGAWRDLQQSGGPLWTDDYASILPYLQWDRFL